MRFQASPVRALDVLSEMSTTLDLIEHAHQLRKYGLIFSGRWCGIRNERHAKDSIALSVPGGNRTTTSRLSTQHRQSAHFPWKLYILRQLYLYDLSDDRPHGFALGREGVRLCSGGATAFKGVKGFQSPVRDLRNQFDAASYCSAGLSASAVPVLPTSQAAICFLELCRRPSSRRRAPEVSDRARQASRVAGIWWQCGLHTRMAICRHMYAQLLLSIRGGVSGCSRIVPCDFYPRKAQVACGDRSGTLPVGNCVQPCPIWRAFFVGRDPWLAFYTVCHDHLMALDRAPLKGHRQIVHKFKRDGMTPSGFIKPDGRLRAPLYRRSP